MEDEEEEEEEEEDGRAFVFSLFSFVIKVNEYLSIYFISLYLLVD